MQRVVPAIRVASYQRSKSLYEALGFREQWAHQFEAGLPTFASVAFDEMQVFLTEHAGDCQFGSLVHFYVEDVDALFEDIKTRGVTVAEPPNNGLGPDIRGMLVVDLDGNRLMFLTVKNAKGSR